MPSDVGAAAGDDAAATASADATYMIQKQMLLVENGVNNLISNNRVEEMTVIR